MGGFQCCIHNENSNEDNDKVALLANQETNEDDKKSFIDGQLNEAQSIDIDDLDEEFKKKKKNLKLEDFEYIKVTF